MSVLIRGMEMPTSCSVCPMLEGDRMDGLCHAASRWLDDDEFWTWYVYPEGDIDPSKPCNCPLAPVPPHGRLIDADALMLEIKDYIEEYDELDENGYHNLKWCAMKEAEATIENAPTIIPANPAEEG